MTIFPSETRVFYNPDCAKYGVQKIVKGIVLDGKQLYKWSQVDPHPNQPNRSAYTHYKGVAERWANKIREHGVIEVRADMEEDYR